MTVSKSTKMIHLLNFRLRVILLDRCIMTGHMLAFDKHMNLVLSDCEEFRKIKTKAGSSGTAAQEQEHKRTLGLVILRGETIVSMRVEAPPPTLEGQQARLPQVYAGTGMAAPAGQAPFGLAGPVRGVGGPASGMMLPRRSAIVAPPFAYGRGIHPRAVPPPGFIFPSGVPPGGFHPMGMGLPRPPPPSGMPQPGVIPPFSFLPMGQPGVPPLGFRSMGQSNAPPTGVPALGAPPAGFCPGMPPFASPQGFRPGQPLAGTYPLNPRDLHRLTRVGGPTEIVFHTVQTGVSILALYNIVSTIHFQLIDGYFSPTAWFLLLACLFSITTAVGYGLLAWWTRTASVQEEIKMSVRLAHTAAIEAAHVQAQVQAHAAQGNTRASSSSLWSLAEKSNSPTSSSSNGALTPGRRSKILRVSAFVLCPLPRVCILLGLVALTLLASILQGYRIRKGIRCLLYDEPLRGFCRSTKSAVGAVFLESVLWLCWFAFWFFVSFHKAPRPDEMEIGDDGCSVVRMGLSQHTVAPTAGAANDNGGGRRGDSDLELTMMPSGPVQWNQSGSVYSPVTPIPTAAVGWHDSRKGDLDEHRKQSRRPLPTPEKEVQGSRSLASSSSSCLPSLSSSSSSTLHPDGRTMQQRQKQDKRQPSPSTSAAATAGTEVLTPTSRAGKAHPPAPPRINTTSAVPKVATKFEGPRTRGSHHSGPPSTSPVSSFSVRMPDTSGASPSSHRNSRNSILVPTPSMTSRQSNRMSRSLSADVPLDSNNGQGRSYSATSLSSTTPATAITRPRSTSLGPSGVKAAISLLRPPPCPLPSATNNNTNNSTTSNSGNRDKSGKFGRNRPNSSEFILLSLQDQQKVDMYWEGQLPYPPPPPLSPTSPSVGAFFSDLEDSEKERVLTGNRISFQSRQAQVRSSTQ
ncbi:hypothetical protein KI688_008241 [Linnemannia hyalina]|uniref:Sm protein B n=1 Tax=Linnemannia hyalina TaxID=64524 RepID=A0A9P7Y1Z8_9FUNG|nr:hypothetical protein KI688_008241 [Linnemannia hyalina]